MKVIYFNFPSGTDKIAFTLNEEPIKKLIEKNIIPSGSKYVVKNYPDIESIPEEDKVKMLHVDKLKFDNPLSPSDVVFDFELLSISFLELFKSRRNLLLHDLDSLQMRALAAGKTEIVEEIEEDKQKLRDFTKETKIFDVKTLDKFSEQIPDILLIDYYEKYSDRVIKK